MDVIVYKDRALPTFLLVREFIKHIREQSTLEMCFLRSSDITDDQSELKMSVRTLSRPAFQSPFISPLFLHAKPEAPSLHLY